MPALPSENDSEGADIEGNSQINAGALLVALRRARLKDEEEQPFHLFPAVELWGDKPCLILCLRRPGCSEFLRVLYTQANTRGLTNSAILVRAVNCYAICLHAVKGP